LFGACKTKVEDPVRDRCSAHQYSEDEIKPLLDEAVNLLDSFMVALSANYEKRTKRVVSKYDELFLNAKLEKAAENAK
jgi:hypothetical protein